MDHFYRKFFELWQTVDFLRGSPQCATYHEINCNFHTGSPVKTGHKRRLSAAPTLDIINEETFEEDSTPRKSKGRLAEKATIEISKIETPASKKTTIIDESSEVKRKRGRPPKTQPIPIETIEEEPHEEGTCSDYSL